MHNQWEHARAHIHKLSSLADLHAALDDHEAFIGGIAELVATAIKKRCLAQLQPHLEPLLTKHGVTWQQALPMFSQLVSMDRLQAAVADPDAFVKELLSSAGPLAKTFAIAKLRPVLEPMLIKQGIIGSTIENAAATAIEDKGKAAAEAAVTAVAGATGGSLAGLELQLPHWESVLPVFNLIETLVRPVAPVLAICHNLFDLVWKVAESYRVPTGGAAGSD